MRNNNGAAIRRLSSRSLKNNRIRNVFAVLAITLTGMLFTAVFSFLGGMMQMSQETTMHEVGGRFHAGLKHATTEQYEKVAANPLVERSSYNILIGYANNILRRQAEVRYLPSEQDLPDYFITLQEGSMPVAEDEIVVDTYVLDEFHVPHHIGEKVVLCIPFLGGIIEKEFTVSGWYQGDSIGHASQIFISEEFWLQCKGTLTEEDFKIWAEEHPESSGVGLLSGQLFFGNASNIEEKVQTVIREAGYEPGTELDYGVNWAYMSNRLESVDFTTLLLLSCVVLVILLTGYLIINNIFQISVMGDIRFYGLLKTIGTTRKQLSRLIMRQVLMLSIIGIPTGLLLGFVIVKASIPFMLQFMDYGDLEISLKVNPWMMLFAAFFSVCTVFLSCRKPGKIAGNVSPVEAIKYTEGMTVNLKKRKRHAFSLVGMAFANLSRNKKKTGAVIAAISLSMVLLTLVMTGIGSFRIEQFLEQRIVGDIMIGNNIVFNTISRYADYKIDSDYVALARSQEGIEKENELWCALGSSVKLEEKGFDQFRKLEQAGKLIHNEYTEREIQEKLDKSNALISGFVYGYSDDLLKNLKVLEGSLDIEKFQKGNYILLGLFRGMGDIETADSLYHPKDMVTISSITKDSVPHEIRDESGEIIDIWYENRTEKEYEVMAVVELPYSMDIHRYSYNGMDVVLPIRELQDGIYLNNYCFAYSYQIEENCQKAFEAAIKNYVENVNPYTGYASKQTLRKEFSGMIHAITAIGIGLAGVIGLIGILNFVNAVFTGIIARKREFAMLQSIGMTSGQLQKMLICEGVSYIIFAGIISFIVGSILAYAVLSVLNNVILFFAYQFQILPFVIMIPLLIAVAIVIPIISFGRIQKHSVVERLREAE